MNDKYKRQVSFLLKVIPEVGKEKNFALHGGTAINMFHQNMPRLSVDIDLTYIPFTEIRENDLHEIRTILARIKSRLQKTIPSIHFEDQIRAEEELKLICIFSGAMIKIEVNQINRGVIDEPVIFVLCEKAQVLFDTFCEVQLVPKSQLWGGKIIAALDRQHPRDIFDIRGLMNKDGYSDEIQTGFLFCLLSSKRPIHEILNPILINHQVVFTSQFNGMTDEPFLYDEFEEVRNNLINTVNQRLTLQDKKFLLDFAKAEPIWDRFDYSMFPGIKWKLLNIRNLKNSNYTKFLKQINSLEIVLYQNDLKI